MALKSFIKEVLYAYKSYDVAVHTQKKLHVMVVVCVSWLLLGFLLLIVKLFHASSVDVNNTLDGWEDTVVPNYQLLLQLGLVQLIGSVMDTRWMLPHDIFLF